MHKWEYIIKMYLREFSYGDIDRDICRGMANIVRPL